MDTEQRENKEVYRWISIGYLTPASQPCWLACLVWACLGLFGLVWACLGLFGLFGLLLKCIFANLGTLTNLFFFDIHGYTIVLPLQAKHCKG
jgi:hypothetical protein